jgi:hypothetical protein
MIATILEVFNDRHGDLNKSQDLILRIVLLLAEAVALHFIFHKPIFDCLLVSTAFFFLCFDYLVTYVLIKNKVIEPRIGGGHTWFSYTGKKGFFDNIRAWRNLNPWGKLAVKVSFFVLSILICFWL